VRETGVGKPVGKRKKKRATYSIGTPSYSNPTFVGSAGSSAVRR
jgi:hypothetical protein